MSSILRIQLFAVALVLILSQVAAHTYLTRPTSRSNQGQTQTGCRGPSCLGPCDVPLSRATRAPIVAARGDTIQVDWPRNNHAGGFIRFAWAPTALSDNHAAFDAHVQQINCHEIGNPTPGECAPSDPINDPNGGGSGPGDGSSGACTTTIRVPLDLTDGRWTLQWAWFGGAFALGDYYSCVDYTISGGAIGLSTPVFIGGDFSYPGQQKCKFFNTDKLHVCTNEPCQAPIYPAGARSGPPAAGQLGLGIGININISVGSPTPSAPVTTAAPVARPVTTAAVPVARPVTTGANVIQSATTGRVAARPSTTGRIQAAVTTARPVSSSAPTSSCAGPLSASTSTARIESLDSWGSQFHVLVKVTVSEQVLSDWVLQVQWPAQAASSQIIRWFNSGTLQCEDTMNSYFKPVAAWANNLSRGTEFEVEFISSNPDNLDVNFLLSNIQLQVLKQ